MLIRLETRGDYAATRKVNLNAFGSPLEATLVERLREDGLVIALLVAVDDAGHVAGHILFSPLTILSTHGGQMQVASFAPVSVLPSHQRRGIGSMLVEHGIDACRRAQYPAVILVGHPGYYPRFGFSHVLVARLKNPFAANEAFMGLELVRGLCGHSGPRCLSRCVQPVLLTYGVVDSGSRRATTVWRQWRLRLSSPFQAEMSGVEKAQLR